ncbi:TetR/AcrR family transcriptional regulator [Hymenobacter sp. BT664]|uniref:TetR/AcrR family transcriptional regulator n=1 Tax=Hymenobacter montanus TaxID=2771359 RepID=A0A927GLC3_9BACT|nr:TetR/AcrR family transcriptional regulator [Hymenobacter montanus]MBD2770442.1 TetR/AcrR family transcriptional regulator [Hymenobacter montanus]
MARPRKFDESAVLGQALDLFWRRGYEATSMEELVQGMGINRFSLYDTFGDKRRLYLRALRRYREEAGGIVCQFLAQPRPALALVGELLATTVDESTGAQRQRGCFMVNSAVEVAPHDDEVAQEVVANQRAIEAQLAAVLARGQAEGNITRRHPPAALAAFVFTTLNGLKVMGKMNADAGALRQVADVALAGLAAGVGAA